MSVLTLDPDDQGRDVAVSVGDRIVLRLPENPTTGYRWAGEIPALLRLTRDENEAGDAPGAAGFRVLELIAVAQGRATLNLECGQAWEPSEPSLDQFSVRIEVR